MSDGSYSLVVGQLKVKTNSLLSQMLLVIIWIQVAKLSIYSIAIVESSNSAIIGT